MEEIKKTDRRIAKTKKAIRNAFVKLLVEKDIEKISVKEIADLADVDRKTVYNYYAGVYEIREELENDLLADLKKCTHDLVYDINDPMSVFRVFARIIEENYEVYSQLITSYGPYTSAKLYYYLKEYTDMLLEHFDNLHLNKWLLYHRLQTQRLKTKIHY